MTREKVYVLLGFLTFMTLVCSAIIWWFKRRGSKLAADCVKELESKEFVQLLTVGKNIPYIENLPSIEEKWMAPWIRNSEIILDRKVADKRIYPAIDITRSGTRKEEILLENDELQKMYVLRRILNPMGTMDSIEFLLSKLKETKDNTEFFQSMNKSG